MLERLRAPDTFVLLGSILLLTAAFTWFLPGGSYDREERDGRQVVVAGSFETVESEPQGLWDVLRAPIRGFVAAAEVIGFVLLVGGAFGVIQETGALTAGIGAVARSQEQRPGLRAVLIPMLMVMFSLGGAIFGMSEEVIPFILIMVPLALALGYDTIVGVAIPFVGAGAGFAGAFLNPFTVGIAQGIAELPPFSGLGYRVIVWCATTTVAVLYVMLYARRITRDPESSPTYAQDLERRRELGAIHEQDETFTPRHALVIAALGLGILGLAVGVVSAGWYIEEICAVFMVIAIVAAVAGRLSATSTIRGFTDGAKDLLTTALVIAMARAILVIAEDGRIIDTVLHGLASTIDGLHPIFAAQTMFLTQTAINFFVPSGSGQAALTMPIMAPLADLLEVPRQVAVLAFQMGDGFSNLIIPTSAVCMGVLTMARIDWARWARWMLPLQLIFFTVGLLLLVPPFLFGWN